MLTGDAAHRLAQENHQADIPRPLPSAFQHPRNRLLKQILPFHLMKSDSSQASNPFQPPKVRVR